MPNQCPFASRQSNNANIWLRRGEYSPSIPFTTRWMGKIAFPVRWITESQPPDCSVCFLAWAGYRPSCFLLLVAPSFVALLSADCLSYCQWSQEVYQQIDPFHTLTYTSWSVFFFASVSGCIVRKTASTGASTGAHVSGKFVPKIPRKIWNIRERLCASSFHRLGVK